jgi:UDP-N-acetyl-D-mannosaminuronic acid dehydrogenase
VAKSGTAAIAIEGDSVTGPFDLVVVGGAGHVGLPFSLAFADRGLRVGIYDVDQDALARIRRGEMPFQERGADELLHGALQSGKLDLSHSPEMIERASTVVVVIGTPIDEFLNPSRTVFDEVISLLAQRLQPDALLVLRSTVFPGTAGYIQGALAARGLSVHVAFCPERIAEGNAVEELTTLPQIIGADDPVAAERAEQLFAHLGVEIIHTSSLEAELAKLFTNAWRYMKFAVANQFFMVAHAAGVDYTRVLDAVRQDYPRAKDLPGPGFAAGPCLLKDTMQLAAFTADHFPLGQSAMQINEGLPAYIVSAMQRRFGDLHGRSVGILGMAFKAESDDPRASLSFKLRKLLAWSGANVLCTDPYVVDDRLESLDHVLDTAEILVVGAPHQAYRDLDLKGREVVDVWGFVTGRILL